MKRCYTLAHLSKDSLVKLEQDSFHHYIRVLRLKEGDHLALFNEKDGGFKGEISLVNKKEAYVRLSQQLKPASKLCYKGLVFSLLKNDSLSWLIEKATELGVTDFYPIITSYSTQKIFKEEKFKRVCQDAVEQCERLCFPTFHPLQTLEQALNGWDQTKILYTAIERLDESSNLVETNDAAFLVGPEGGWKESEKELFKTYPFIKPVSLGPLILRAETAALVLLSRFSV